MATELGVQDTDFLFRTHRTYPFSPQPDLDLLAAVLSDVAAGTPLFADFARRGLTELRRLRIATSLKNNHQSRRARVPPGGRNAQIST